MQYLLLIYSDENIQKNMSNDERGAYFQAYTEFTGSIQKSGNMAAGDALLPIETATSVRVRNGETLLTDGPFAETKEQLGGYYLVEAPDLDAATAIAARIPTTKHGTIEVRPIMVWE